MLLMLIYLLIVLLFSNMLICVRQNFKGLSQTFPDKKVVTIVSSLSYKAESNKKKLSIIEI